MIDPVADNIVFLDVTGELRVNGRAAVRGAGISWLDLYEGPPRWENRDTSVVADGDIAFSHMLSHVTGHRKDDVNVDMWFRTALRLRRIGGDWRIVHEHQSSPFDAESKASLGLRP